MAAESCLKDKGFQYFQSCREGLKNDLEFYHSPHENYLYLYCADGNPARVFNRVELSLYGEISSPRSSDDVNDVTYDNLAFKYCNFGIGGFGNAKNLTVRNCEFIGIGGALTQPDRAKNKPHTPEDRDACRYGNAIEIYGVCDGYYVENCYFDQVYDAAVTVQYPQRGEMTRDLIINDVKWVNNLFQRCNYPFELWLYSPEDTNGFTAAQRNIDISGNIAINTGFGWSNHRMDPNNTFYYAGYLGATNCEFGWICGSSQFPEMYERKAPDTPFGDDTTRLGNAVEIYGTADNYTVENNYFYQIYDAAITAQVNAGAATHKMAMENIRWVNNVIDTTHYCFELWLDVREHNGNEVYMANIDISGNICFNEGYGWSHQRFDPGYQFYYGGGKGSATMPITNCALHDNIFVNGKKRIISAAHIGGENMKFYGNKIYHNGVLGNLPESLDGNYEKLACYEMDDETIEKLEGSGYFGKNEYYKIADTENENPYIVKI